MKLFFSILSYELLRHVLSVSWTSYFIKIPIRFK